MSLKITLTVAVLSLGLVAVQATAETAGAGDPFPFRAPAQISNGHPFVADTGRETYPELTGQVAQPAPDVEMAPSYGNEAPVQSANSLPRGFSEGTAAYAQAQIQKRYAEAARVRLASRSDQPKMSATAYSLPGGDELGRMPLED